MPLKKKKAKTKSRKDSISLPFLIQTLVSIQSALVGIDKESSAKTEALSAVSENINVIAEMMKHFHDQNVRDGAKIIDLEGEIKSLHGEIKLLDKDSDIKEIKFAIQKAEASLAELKIIKQVKEDLEETKEVKSGKWNLISFVGEFVNGLKNLKMVLIVILVILLFVSSLIYGPSVIQTFIDIVKKILA